MTNKPYILVSFYGTSESLHHISSTYDVRTLKTDLESDGILYRNSDIRFFRDLLNNPFNNLLTYYNILVRITRETATYSSIVDSIKKLKYLVNINDISFILTNYSMEQSTQYMKDYVSYLRIAGYNNYICNTYTRSQSNMRSSSISFPSVPGLLNFWIDSEANHDSYRSYTIMLNAIAQLEHIKRSNRDLVGGIAWYDDRSDHIDIPRMQSAFSRHNINSLIPYRNRESPYQLFNKIIDSCGTEIKLNNIPIVSPHECTENGTPVMIDPVMIDIETTLLGERPITNVPSLITVDGVTYTSTDSVNWTIA